MNKCKGNNIAENDLTKTIFKLELLVVMTRLHSKFPLKMSMYDRENERNLKLLEFFQVQGA